MVIVLDRVFRNMYLIIVLGDLGIQGGMISQVIHTNRLRWWFN